MSRESTTPDLVELVRRSFEAANRGDVNATLSDFGPDSVWDDSAIGLGTHEGLVAIRAHYREWIGAYEEFAVEAEEILDLGHGVVFVVALQKGRPVGSTGQVQLRYATVAVWAEGATKRFTTYTDIGEARAAAERLVHERAQADA